MTESPHNKFTVLAEHPDGGDRLEYAFSNIEEANAKALDLRRFGYVVKIVVSRPNTSKNH